MSSLHPVILIVDDEPQIHRFLRPALESAGYGVASAGNGAAALASFAEPPDLVLLDLGLPDLDGQEVLIRLRRQSEVPVIVLSARDQEAEKIAALDNGANDYVEKPFGIGELLARIRSNLRKAPSFHEPGRIVEIDGLSFDAAKSEVRLNGSPVHLTRTEYRLLEMMIENRGRLMTHGAVIRKIWRNTPSSEVDSVRIYVSQLRRKLGEYGTAHIKTRQGIGYVFE